MAQPNPTFQSQTPYSIPATPTPSQLIDSPSQTLTTHDLSLSFPDQTDHHLIELVEIQPNDPNIERKLMMSLDEFRKCSSLLGDLELDDQIIGRALS
ncbi:hypothetical protein CDL15_Pgr017644 [Punica granatum]|uniref:Uncharacterized protein n=1 Tax=Punica granatum TaxID=22663 RepID=A0A218XQX9_PUNGR|nr:hypothetical protein CDL15_Pgr017644 [Punica granatum]